MRRSRVPEITVEYLLTRTTQTPRGCIEWAGARTTRGYGRIGRYDRERYTHRVMWELTNGQPIPPGMVVRHRCDNPPCLNPEHLELGTTADNNRDALERGRQVPSKVRGSGVGTAKLTEAQVAEIKAALRAGEPMTVVARRFGVSKFPIQEIVHGRAWRHVP